MTPLSLCLPNPPLHSLSTQPTTIPTTPTTDTGLQFRRKLLYLESLNINSLKALSKNPHFRSSPLQTLITVEQTLTSPSFNLPRSSLGRILDMFPQLLTASPSSLLLISDFLLRDVALPYSLLPRAVTRCPRILVSDVDSQLLPTFHFLRHHLNLSFSYRTRVLSTYSQPTEAPNDVNPDDYSTGVLSTYSHPTEVPSDVNPDDYNTGVLSTYSQSRVGDFQYKLNMNTIVLLVSSVEHTLLPKLEFLRKLGFEEGEVINMVQRSPALLTYSIEHNFVPKIRYFLDEMKGDLVEIKRFPQYFSFSLEGKIKPRHRLLVEYGFQISLSDMLKVSDGEFNVRLLEMKLRRIQL